MCALALSVKIHHQKDLDFPAVLLANITQTNGKAVCRCYYMERTVILKLSVHLEYGLFIKYTF